MISLVKTMQAVKGSKLKAEVESVLRDIYFYGQAVADCDESRKGISIEGYMSNGAFNQLTKYVRDVSSLTKEEMLIIDTSFATAYKMLKNLRYFLVLADSKSSKDLKKVILTKALSYARKCNEEFRTLTNTLQSTFFDSNIKVMFREIRSTTVYHFVVKGKMLGSTLIRGIKLIKDRCSVELSSNVLAPLVAQIIYYSRMWSMIAALSAFVASRNLLPRPFAKFIKWPCLFTDVIVNNGVFSRDSYLISDDDFQCKSLYHSWY